MQCVVLAGGLGTRLKPLTLQLPKHLAPVGGRPFADLQLARLAHQGVTEVVYCIGKFGHMIQDFVADGGRWGLSVRWVDEGDHLLGTAGALRLAADQGALGERFLVVYGDSLLSLSYGAMWRAHEEHGLPATMAVLRNQGQWDTSNVRYRDGRVLLYDKVAAARGDGDFDHIDYGAALLDRSVVLDRVPANEKFDLAIVYNRLSLEGLLAGFEAQQRFYEIGSPRALMELERWLEKHPEQDPRPAAQPSTLPGPEDP